jgi:hypothetical protein
MANSKRCVDVCETMIYYVLHNFCGLHNKPKIFVWDIMKWNDSFFSLDKMNCFQKEEQTKKIVLFTSWLNVIL